jgi:hypothetical protein
MFIQADGSVAAATRPRQEGRMDKPKKKQHEY